MPRVSGSGRRNAPWASFRWAPISASHAPLGLYQRKVRASARPPGSASRPSKLTMGPPSRRNPAQQGRTLLGMTCALRATLATCLVRKPRSAQSVAWEESPTTTSTCHQIDQGQIFIVTRKKISIVGSNPYQTEKSVFLFCFLFHSTCTLYIAKSVWFHTHKPMFP